MKKDNRQKAVEVIIKALVEYPSESLIRLAAENVISGYTQGYNELTENKELVDLVSKFTCEYCGRFHSVKECQAYGVKEYRAMGKKAWEKKYPD